mgnify:CR=1 FL=1
MQGMIGRTLGQYVIEAEIGRTSTAWLYRGTQPSIGRQVAIKVLAPQTLGEETLLERFRREAQIGAWLQHPHIVPVYDSGEDQGIPYIVMRHYPGGTLLDAIHRLLSGLPLNRVRRIIAQVGTALDYAHDRGIIHRNVKPANIHLDDAGNAYLSDFGLARITGKAKPITGSGALGTPAYMAPEAFRLDGVTPLIEPPYDDPHQIAVLLAHMNEPIPDICQIRPDLPPEVQAVVEKVMAKNPSERYQTAAAFARALDEAARRAPPESRTEAVEQPLPPVSVSEPAGEPEPLPDALPASEAPLPDEPPEPGPDAHATGKEPGADSPPEPGEPEGIEEPLLAPAGAAPLEPTAPPLPPEPSAEAVPSLPEPAGEPPRRRTGYVSPPTPPPGHITRRDVAERLRQRAAGPQAASQPANEPPPTRVSAPAGGVDTLEAGRVSRREAEAAVTRHGELGRAGPGQEEVTALPMQGYSTPSLVPDERAWSAWRRKRRRRRSQLEWAIFLALAATIVCLGGYALAVTLVLTGVIAFPFP